MLLQHQHPRRELCDMGEAMHEREQQRIGFWKSVMGSSALVTEPIWWGLWVEKSWLRFKEELPEPAFGKGLTNLGVNSFQVS